MTIRRATAIAHPNIALAKYWGKQSFGFNLPAVPSLSVTLSGMATRTTVTFDPSLKRDELRLAGNDGGEQATSRVSGMLDRVRAASGIVERALVESDNDFPTASGLASSASAFAALAVASSGAAGLASDASAMSDLARKTSVSAARSLFGGFVALRAGMPGDEALAAEPVALSSHWDLRVIVAVTHEGPKAIGSTDGMLHTVRTSPYFPAWVDEAPKLFARIRDALLARDLPTLGEAVEQSALMMHASSIASAPAVLYWNAATIDAIAAVRALRASGIAAYATIDAGPHVKVLTTSRDEAAVDAALQHVPSVLRTIRTTPGEGARLVDEAPGAE